MKFIDLVNNLKVQYKNDTVIRKNGTMLLQPQKMPKCRHMLFKPLNSDYINEYLIDAYQNTFPEEYIKFLKYSNGANLFHVKLTSNSSFAYSMFVIFGLPLKPPYDRPKNEEEPYDMRTEDNARHPDIPDNWLKCGQYIRNEDFNVVNDIFIDTCSGRIYACVKRENKIIDSWDSLDECFCSVFESLTGCKDEYVY